jgi:hypothetical protein
MAKPGNQSKDFFAQESGSSFIGLFSAPWFGVEALPAFPVEPPGDPRAQKWQVRPRLAA